MQKLFFDANGGTCGAAWDEYTIGTLYSYLPGATWSGYVFTGWFTDAEGGTQVTANDTVTQEAERTVYAHWREGDPEESLDGITWKYTVSNGVATVGSGLYAGDRAVPPSTSGSISIPSKLGGHPVGKIADYAFYGCTGLGSVTVPKSVTNIGKYAFSGCLQLSSVTLADSVTEVGEYAFNTCPVLKSVSLPSKVGTVAEGLFSNCQRLTSVKLPSGVREIGESAFYRCEALKSVTIPAGVTNIGKYAFYECGGLKTVNVPDGVRVLPESTFEGCWGLESVRLPAGLAAIGSRVFKGCERLAAVEIPSGVTVLGARALEGCVRLESVRVPEGVLGIRTWTFSGCSALGEVELTGATERIGAGAFAECWQLESKELPVPTRVHYRFEGWWTAAAGGNKVETFGQISGTEKELFARWTPETYAIRYHANGGEGTMDEQTFAYGSPVTLRDNAFSREGWAFAGWAVTAGGEAVYADGAQVEDLTEGGDLYAVWKKVLLPETGNTEEVSAALAEAADPRLAEKIRTVADYNDFRIWALGVEGSTGEPAGAEAVMASAHAWASYVLGAEVLFENEPEIRLLGISVGTADGGTMTVRVTVRDGDRIAAVDAVKIAGLFEATGEPGDWTDGALPVSATEKGMEGEALVFEAEVMAEDDVVRRVFLRVGENGQPTAVGIKSSGFLEGVPSRREGSEE